MNRTRRDIEALADLFVGIPVTPVPATEDRIIRVIEGHLPVRSTLWRQPALGLIVDRAPATLLEVDDRQVHVTRHGEAQAEQPAELEHVIGQPDAGHTWVVASSMVTESAADWSHYDEVVLLTGADQAASVAAYRHIKTVLTSSSTPPTVSFIMAGSPEPLAQAAADRLMTTASSHLSATPVCRGVLSQIDAGPVSASHTVPAGASSVLDVVASIRARVSAAPLPSTADAATASTSPQSVAPSVDVTVASLTEQAPAAMPASLTPAAMEPADHQDVCVAVDAANASADAAWLFPDLQQVHIQELPSGILAGVDADGSLHVLAIDDAGLLEVARLWAMRHRSLLAASIPALNEQADVRADLIVHDVHRASDLASGPWRVHLKMGDQVTHVPPRTH